MKICLVNITAMPDEYVEPYSRMVAHSYKKVVRPDTEVVLKPVRRGFSGANPAEVDNPYFSLLNRREIVEAFVEAEREGFDAASVHCFGDPGVKEARSVVGMPIFGPSESSMHFASQLGGKFAIIGATLPGQRVQLSEQVRQAGLESRLIPDGIRFHPCPFEETYGPWQKDPEAGAAEVAKVAEQAVRDGADSVILGCAGLCLIASTVGFNKVEVDGREVPIIDAVTIAIKTAEMAVDIRKGTGMPIPSRARNLAMPSPEEWARVRAAYDLPA